jgi:hypothetical protein
MRLGVFGVFVAVCAAVCAREVSFSVGSDESHPVSPVVSLIMPANSEVFGHYLRLGLDAARAQTYANIELIIVDASVTAHPGVVPLDDMPWVTYVHTGEGKGEGASGGGRTSAETMVHQLSMGVVAARGAIIGVWNGMDIHSPEQVEAQVAPIVSSEAGTWV